MSIFLAAPSAHEGSVQDELLHQIDETSDHLRSLARQIAMLADPTAHLDSDTAHSSAVAAATIWQIRARRSQIFGSDLFGEPAWDMLLALYAIEVSNRRESVTGICHASGVPYTTALRHLQRLETENLIEQTPDPKDGRRKWVNLTPEGRCALDKLLSHVSVKYD